MASPKIRRQPPIKGGRRTLHPSVLPAIDDAVRLIARQRRVSASWVQAVILADALDIPNQAHYEEEKPPRRR